MNIRISLYTFLFFVLSTNIVNAREKYTDEMQGYIGTWVHEDKLGNISTYRILVSDGWVIIRYKFEEHFHDGTEWEGMANKKYTIDYTYKNGKFYFDEDYPPYTYNSMILELKEGSLIQTVYQRGRDDKGKEYSRSWSYAYDADF